MMTSTIDMIEMGKKAKLATKVMALAKTTQKNQALESIAKNLEKHQKKILEANSEDIVDAKASGMDPAMLDRLSLEGRLEGIVKETRKLIDLPDPIGKIIETRTLENGLTLTKKRTPIGVLGVIYESRPNVTIDVSALTIKTGNCAILRGGSETININQALIEVVHESLEEVNLPREAVQFIASPDRSLVNELLHLYNFVDMIIPRGGAGLHQFCRENSTIPVITGGIGICHLFIDESADLPRALEVVFNAKTQRPTVCNALDTLLVHQSVAQKFIPEVIKKLGKSNVKFKLDKKALQQVEEGELAQDQDWDTEWLSLVLGIKVVENLEEAIEHIQAHSSGHSDGILTATTEHIKKFVDEVDSSSVYVNASTRFTDGAEFGLGAEVAISTQKLHARGPMGLEELTTYKWIVEGDYHVRK